MPACPKCGCNATTLFGAGERFGRPWAKFGCTFCGGAFSIGATRPEEIPQGPIQNGVKYRTVHCSCPNCGAPNPPVKSTQGRVRYHRCDKCQSRFKSVED